MTAVLSWCLSLPTAGFVPIRDDGFLFPTSTITASSLEDDLTHSRRFSTVYFLLEGLKLKLHERQSGPTFSFLGWEWAHL